MPLQLPADFKVTQQESYKEPALFHACEISRPFDHENITYLESFAVTKKIHADYLPIKCTRVCKKMQSIILNYQVSVWFSYTESKTFIYFQAKFLMIILFFKNACDQRSKCKKKKKNFTSTRRTRAWICLYRLTQIEWGKLKIRNNKKRLINLISHRHKSFYMTKKKVRL